MDGIPFIAMAASNMLDRRALLIGAAAAMVAAPALAAEAFEQPTNWRVTGITPTIMGIDTVSGISRTVLTLGGMSDEIDSWMKPGEFVHIGASYLKGRYLVKEKIENLSSGYVTFELEAAPLPS